MLIPRQKVPSLSANLVGGGTFDLSTDAPIFATLVVFFTVACTAPSAQTI